MRLTHIVAMAENRVIGRDGGLPWRIPEDFKFFKATTSGHAIVMGRKTYESIKRALPDRLNVVVTRDPDFKAEGVVTQASLTDAIRYCEAQTPQWGDEVFIIGGGEVYRQSLDYVQRIYLTRVHQKVDGDTFYPDIDETEFTETILARGQEPVAYTISRLDRK